MRLVKASIHGFGRLADGTINLDSKVIAIVGPNEAGKTTLLRALRYIDDESSLPLASRSRAVPVADNDEVVRVQFVLDKTDKAVVADLDLEEAPTSLWLSRVAAGGEIRKTVEPRPRRAEKPLNDAWALIVQFARSGDLSELDEPADLEDGGIVADDPKAALRDQFEDLVDSIESDTEHLGLVSQIVQRAGLLDELHERITAMVPTPSVAEALNRIVSWSKTPDPATIVGDRLWEHSPDFLFFDDAERTLRSSYVLSDELLADLPPALANLANMAELDIPGLWANVQSGDLGGRETRLINANDILKKKFELAWKQSNLTARFTLENTTISVTILQNGNSVTVFDERSAGLRMFVALIAFLAERGSRRPPILLIDEAENHLHIDAQADLVNTFMSQEQASKIIYTTHSPACLPPDLGSNIRSVLPSASNVQTSDILSSFWHGAAGFSPLMLAMGAAAAAFSAARYVVLAEGASEMLMLPSLIRAATGEASLLYQVAPGLSEVPASFYPDLDLEGSHVAFLVDGDSGGLAKRAALVDSGHIPEGRVVTLGALTLENLLDESAYLSVVEKLLEECNPGTSIPALPALGSAQTVLWPTQVEDWAIASGLKMPGKRAVASRLVEEHQAIPSEFGTLVLRTLNKELLKVLKN